MSNDVTLNLGVGGKVVKTTDISGKQVQRVNAGNTTVRTSTTSTTDVVILTANIERIRAEFYNDADKDFLIGEGTAPLTTSDFTYRIRPGGSRALDDSVDEIHGMFVATPGSGSLLITEVS